MIIWCMIYDIYIWLDMYRWHVCVNKFFTCTIHFAMASFPFLDDFATSRLVGRWGRHAAVWCPERFAGLGAENFMVSDGFFFVSEPPKNQIQIKQISGLDLIEHPRWTGFLFDPPVLACENMAEIHLGCPTVWYNCPWDDKPLALSSWTTGAPIPVLVEEHHFFASEHIHNHQSINQSTNHH